MKTKKPIIVTGKRAEAIKAHAEAKAAKREAWKNEPIKDISKLQRVG